MSMKRLLAIFCLIMLALPMVAQVQEYVVPEISISKDKVRIDGKTYYAHVVQAKQTLFSISKAYGVNVADIYAANENLDIENQGIKAGQVLMIPTESTHTAEKQQSVTSGDATRVVSMPQTSVQSKDTTSSKALFPKLKDLADKVFGAKDSSYVKDIPDVVNVAILLPFGSTGKADEKCLDFYAGALLAARDLGTEGKKININALDVTVSNPDGRKIMNEADVIIGPLSPEGLTNALANVDGKYLVSPLDPKSASLAATENIVQAPTPSAMQYVEMARWVKDDFNRGDSLIVITQSGTTLSEGGQALFDELNSLGMQYCVISYSGSGMETQSKFVFHASKTGTNRYILVSENEAFSSDVVRNVNLMAYKRHDVALYAPSKIKSFGTIDAGQLYNADTHVAASYFIDYKDPLVRKFIKSYRALYEAEPNSFAFHGYDVMHYFVNITLKYGRMWHKKLSEYSENGLQTNFKFIEDNPAGAVNTAVRRAEYTPNLKTRLLK